MGNGGGAIRLIVTGTLTNDGTISANGGSGPGNWPPGPDNYAGGGSGGSIWATVGTLTGSGTFAANGAPRYWGALPTSPAGGGGRIAVYYANGDLFTGFDLSTAAGGPAADKGTVCFINTTENNLLVTGGQLLAVNEDSSLSFHNIEVRNGANLLIGGGSRIDADGTVRVTGNSKIILKGKNAAGQVGGQWVGQGVTLFAYNVQLDNGSSITADGQGYTGGALGQSGNGPGGGGGTAGYDSAGGSHGGLGQSTTCCSAGPTYGTRATPTDLGSGGGGADNSVAGNGGGAIRLIVPQTLTINGTISANGSNGVNYAGGGSGGSIHVNVGILTGSGAFTANGGSRLFGQDVIYPGGGGGRIAIYYLKNNGFNPNSIFANPGVGAFAGTITFEQSTVGNFNGNGKADILWRHDTTGQLILWLMDGVDISDSQSIGTVSDLGWQFQQVGDFNGDSRADILWRHITTGQLFLWLMDGFNIIGYQPIGIVSDLGWQIQKVGDFNGDSKADILWRHDTTGQLFLWLMDGTNTIGYASPGIVTDLNWQIQQVADFDGDSKADILWRHNTTGQLFLWLMDGFDIIGYQPIGTVSDLGWQIQQVGDFNGDGKADILWRHNTTGQLFLWLMDGFDIIGLSTDRHGLGPGLAGPASR